MFYAGNRDRPARAPLNPLVVMLGIVAVVLLLVLGTTIGVAMNYRGRYVEAATDRNEVVQDANHVINEVKIQRDRAITEQTAMLQQVQTCQVLIKVNKHLFAGVDASIEGIEASQQNNQKWLAGRMREVQRQLRAANGVPRDAGFENSQDVALACAGQEAGNS
jgi:hypothetical protein